MTAQDVLQRLQRVKRSGKGWVARCPAHDDKEPSLSISIGEDRRILLHCHAGCAADAVANAIGIEVRDLFDANGNGNGNGRAPEKPVTIYEYRLADGRVEMYRDRYEWLEHGERRKKVLPRQPDGTCKGSPTVPYNLPEVLAAIRNSVPVLVVEGEKCADSLMEHDHVATTTGGTGSWKRIYAQHFQGARVVIWPDNDSPGEDYAAAVANGLQGIAAEVRVLRVPGEHPAGWDAADFFQEGGTSDQLDRLLADAPLWSEQAGVDAEPGDAPGSKHQFVLERLLEGEPPDPPTLAVDNLLLAADVNVFGGDGDAGKSTMSFHIAVATITGRPVFGSLEVKHTGPVVLVVPEDGKAVARHHVDALMAGLPDLSDEERAILHRDLHILSNEQPLDLLKDTAVLAALIADIRPALLILDPIASLIGDANENDEATARAVCENLRRYIAWPMGTAVLIAAHLRKPGRDSKEPATVHDLKGTVGWSNRSRMVWLVSKPKGGCLITLRGVKGNRLQTGLEHQVTLHIDADPENAAHWLTCKLTDANMGNSSVSFTPGTGRAINDNERRALDALDDQHEPGLRLSYSSWFKRSGLTSEPTFKGVRTRLLDAQLATAIPTGKKTRNGGTEYAYAITDGGRTALVTGWNHA